LLNEEEPAGRLKGNHTPDTQRKLLGKNAMKGSTLMAQTTSPAVTYTNTPLVELYSKVGDDLKDKGGVSW
jgi:hypothetical protein